MRSVFIPKAVVNRRGSDGSLTHGYTDLVQAADHIAGGVHPA